MALEKPMYSPIAFSPVATLTSDIAVGSTVIPVSDVNAFPPAPSYATIGTDANAETIRYTAKTSDSLSGCVRGVEGVAQAWQTGESIARNFTAEDHQAIIENLQDLDEGLQQAYSPNNKPTATDVGLGNVLNNPNNIKLFTSANNFGVSGITDASSVQDIYANIPNESILISTPANLTHSSWNFPINNGTVVMFRATNNARGGIVLYSKGATTDYRMGLGDDNKPKGTWTTVYLPLSGGTLTGTQINLGNGYGAVWGSTPGTGGRATLAAYDTVPQDNTHRRILWLNSKASGIDIKNAISLQDVDGTSTSYNIFGEHNKSLLTENVKIISSDTFASGDVRYAKQADGLVWVNVGLTLTTPLSTGAVVTLGTLPVGYRPQTNAQALFRSEYGTGSTAVVNPIAASVTTGGAINLYVKQGNNNNSVIYGSIVFKAVQ